MSTVSRLLSAVCQLLHAAARVLARVSDGSGAPRAAGSTAAHELLEASGSEIETVCSGGHGSRDRVRRATRLIAPLVVGAGAWLSIASASAFAALQPGPYVGQLTGTPSGQFGNVSPVAADTSSSDVYVGQTTSPQSVSKFNSSGALLFQVLGSATPAGSFNPLGGIAVNPATGNVYVADRTNSVVDVFSSAGAYLSQFNGSATPAGSFGPLGIAVDPATGNVYVADRTHAVVDVFSSSGTYLSQFNGSATPAGSFAGLAGIAVAPATGNVYVADRTHAVVDVFSSAGTYLSQFNGSATPAGSFSPSNTGIAVAQSTGAVYVGDSHTVDIFDSAGAYRGQFDGSATPAGLFTPAGLAVEPSGDVYVVDSANKVVDEFGPAVVLPDATTGQASNVQPTSGTLNGTVNADGAPVTDCHFDYGTTGSYGQTAACVETVGSGTSPVQVHADISSLNPDTTYHFRLVASNAHAVTNGRDASFETTGPPIVAAAAPSSISTGGATLFAAVNPRGFDTTYHFEWGTTIAYGNSTPDAQLSAAPTGQVASAQISGLAPGTTYHFRAVATNSQGPATGPDYSFTTPAESCPNATFRTGPSAALPDCRAFEQVSPEEKNGFPTERIGLIGSSGDRVFFSSLGVFAGGSTGGSYIPYLAQRGASGWSTREVAPPETSAASGADPGAATADLGAFITAVPSRPNSQAPYTALTWFLTRVDGSYAQASPTLAPVGGGPITAYGNPEGVSADLSQFEFRAQEPLLPSATQRYPMYEAVGTTSASPSVRLVDVDNNGNEIARCNDEGAFNSMSQDGAVSVFSVWPQSLDPGCVHALLQVYARVNGQTTVSLSDPQPNDECTTSACQTAPTSGAAFDGASVDGSKVFFTSTRQLTDNASEDATSNAVNSIDSDVCRDIPPGTTGCNLYEYDFNRPAGHNLVDLSAGDTSGVGPEVQYVVSVSDDGSHVYFAARGVLSTEPNRLGQTAQTGALNLYVSDTSTGSVSFIGLLCPTGGQSSSLPGVAQCPASVGDVSADTLQLSPDVTRDGRFLVFQTYARLTPDDTNQALDVYEYDSQTGNLVRVSVGHDGEDQNGNGSPQDAFVNPSRDTANLIGVPQHAVSADGQTVVFVTARPLQTGVVNGQQDVYEWHQGEVTLVSGAQSTNSIEFANISESGRDIVFTTDQGLVPQDTDGLLDIYDARIGGGFPPPPATAACAGDACQGSPSGAPPPPLAASVSFSGPGNLTPETAAPPAHVRVLSRTVHGRVFSVAVIVPGPGRITITGAPIRRVARSVARAGTYRLQVQLTNAATNALRHKRKLKLRMRVSLAATGSQPSQTTVVMTVTR